MTPVAHSSEPEGSISRRARLDEEPARDVVGYEVPAFGWLALLIGLCGGLLTGAGIAAAHWASSEPEGQELQRIAAEDVEAAAQSLVAGSAAALVEGAKACTKPLGVLVVHATGRGSGNVRFHSGTYVSPYIRLGPRAERVALPFPAPVEAGHGQIIMDNNSDGADVFLSPGFRAGAGPSRRVIAVHWNAKAPC